MTREYYDIKGEEYEVVRGSKYGVIDTGGHWIVIPTTDPIGFPQDGMIPMGRKGLRRMYNIKGQQEEDKDAREAVLWGFYNAKGDLVIDPIYDEVGSFFEGLCSVKKMCRKTVSNPKNKSGTSTITKALWGFMDKKGSIVIPCIYDRVSAFSEGMAVVVLDGEFTVIGKQGKVLEGLK